MASAKDYEKRIFEILGTRAKRGRATLSLSWDTVPEAKSLLAEIRQMQKRLRLVQKDITAEMKILRARYSSKASTVQPDVGSTLLLGKGKAKSIAASRKRGIKAKKDRALQPYEAVKRIIDGIMIELDAAKIRVSNWLEQNR